MEAPLKHLYQPFCCTCTLVFYRLDNHFLMFYYHHRHIGTCPMHHKQTTIEWKCNIFTLGLDPKYHDTMRNASQLLCTKSLNIWNLGWSYLFNGSMCIAYRLALMTMIEVTRSQSLHKFCIASNMGHTQSQS